MTDRLCLHGTQRSGVRRTPSAPLNTGQSAASALLELQVRQTQRQVEFLSHLRREKQMLAGKMNPCPNDRGLREQEKQQPEERGQGPGRASVCPPPGLNPSAHRTWLGHSQQSTDRA